MARFVKKNSKRVYGYVIRYNPDPLQPDWFRKREVDWIDRDQFSINGNVHHCMSPLAHWFPNFDQAKAVLRARAEERVRMAHSLANKSLADLNSVKAILIEDVKESAGWSDK